jgi:hypothetical protein
MDSKRSQAIVSAQRFVSVRKKLRAEAIVSRAAQAESAVASNL